MLDYHLERGSIMGSGAFAIVFIAGIAMFVTGIGGQFAWIALAVGGAGMVVAGLAGKK